MTQALEITQQTKAHLRQRFGGTVSHVLADPDCATFTVPHIEGLIAYRNGRRCNVAIGDPIAAPADVEQLAEEFRSSSAAAGRTTIFACASEGLTDHLVARGYAAAEYGEELIFDPLNDPTVGPKGRELRKKVSRARTSGMIVREYRPGRSDRSLEQSMDDMARKWLDERHGPQTFVTPVFLFSEPWGRRWFYALSGDRMVGIVTMVRLDAHDGWLFEHLLALQDAPAGATEILVTSALATLGRERCRWATFGPSTIPVIGRLDHVGPSSELLARAIFRVAGRLFHFDSHSHYRRKFQPVRSEPSYLLFHPPRFGLREATGLLRAFNVSLKPR
jgi:lysylphosphatidylglycerol synthetase-like protein (DUF2156 family)